MQIAYEILEDILLQGDHMRDTLRQLQDAVSLTKALDLSFSLAITVILLFFLHDPCHFEVLIYSIWSICSLHYNSNYVLRKTNY